MHEFSWYILTSSKSVTASVSSTFLVLFLGKLRELQLPVSNRMQIV